MHHMMEKAVTIWSKDTGIDRDPADQVEVTRPDDQTTRRASDGRPRGRTEKVSGRDWRRPDFSAKARRGEWTAASGRKFSDDPQDDRNRELAKEHIARTGNTAREMWKLRAGDSGEQAASGTVSCSRIVPR